MKEYSRDSKRATESVSGNFGRLSGAIKGAFVVAVHVPVMDRFPEGTPPGFAAVI